MILGILQQFIDAGTKILLGVFVHQRVMLHEVYKGIGRVKMCGVEDSERRHFVIGISTLRLWRDLKTVQMVTQAGVFEKTFHARLALLKKNFGPMTHRFGFQMSSKNDGGAVCTNETAPRKIEAPFASGFAQRKDFRHSSKQLADGSGLVVQGEINVTTDWREYPLGLLVSPDPLNWNVWRQGAGNLADLKLSE